MNRTIRADASGRVWPDKDPDAVVDYTVDWQAFTQGDTISTSIWTVPAGLTKGTDTFTDETATVFLSGGTTNTAYSIINTVTTADGRTFERSVRLRVLTQ